MTPIDGDLEFALKVLSFAQDHHILSLLRSGWRFRRGRRHVQLGGGLARRPALGAVRGRRNVSKRVPVSVPLAVGFLSFLFPTTSWCSRRESNPEPWDLGVPRTSQLTAKMTANPTHDSGQWRTWMES